MSRTVNCVLLGIEFVHDPESRRPANAAVARLAAWCQSRGLIFQTRGVRGLGNVVRLVPPMTTSNAEVDRAMSILRDGIAAAFRRRRR